MYSTRHKNKPRARYLLFPRRVYCVLAHKHKPKFAHTDLISTFVSCFKPHSKTTFRAVLLGALACYTPSLFLLRFFAGRAHVASTTTTTERFFFRTPFASRKIRGPNPVRYLFFFPSSQTLSLGVVVGFAECRPHRVCTDGGLGAIV